MSEIRFNIILSSTPLFLPMWILPWRFVFLLCWRHRSFFLCYSYRACSNSQYVLQLMQFVKRVWVSQVPSSVSCCNKGVRAYLLICVLFALRKMYRISPWFTERCSLLHCPVKPDVCTWPVGFKRLNMKHRLFYLKTQFVPRSKHFSSRL